MPTTSNTSNFIRPNAAGAAAGITLDDKKQSNNGNLPWSGDDRLNSTFFPVQAIQPDRWNKLYPYRLLVVDVSDGFPTIVSGIGNPNKGAPSTLGTAVASGASSGVSTTFNQVARETGLEYIITQETLTGSWIATLPITPQQLTIKDTFAINTSATMRGVIEEHNGVKFKTIAIQGTTGIWPKRPTKEGSIKAPSATEFILGGTIEALQGLSTSFDRVANIFSGNHPNKVKNSEAPMAGEEFSTGYYQALYIAQFIERYVEAKKNPAFKSWRLVFDMPKQNQAFVVTPVSFDLIQSKEKPNEIMFNMQLKAWKRIEIGQEGVRAAGNKLPNLDPSFLQRAVNGITETRRVLSQAVNLVKAVRSDFQTPFNVMRQTVLALKDLAGLSFSVADLPRQVIEDYKDAISDSNQTLSSAGQNFTSAGQGKATDIPLPGSPRPPAFSGAGGALISSSMRASNRANEGLSNSLVASGALGINAAQQARVDPINDVFKNPEENFDFFNNINLGDLELTPQQQLLIEDEVVATSTITIADLREFRQEMLNLALEISNNFGSANQVYSNIHGRPDPRERSVDLTISENEILTSIFETIQMYDLLTATKLFDDNKEESPLEFVGGLANEAGIEFDQAPSKLLVPVPFGSSIEEIAARYMGDPDKWIEIATINELRSPYIDEEGFTLSLLTNASGRRFNVSTSANNLFVGQKITLQSNTVPVFIRKIIDIEEISETNILITVDGLDNLDSLTTTDNARIQGYLPGTVNSQNQIYIPVSLPSDPDDRVFEIARLDSPNLTKLSKVDFLLTEGNDIAINSVGDFRLANGITNLVQALKLKIQTQKGTLLRHLDYGIGLAHGISVADVESGAILISLNKMIENDPRFQEIRKVSIRLSGSTLGIDMDVSITNSTGVVPVSFNMHVS